MISWTRTFKLAEKRLTQNPKAKPFTEQNIEDASGWNRCAVGEVVERDPDNILRINFADNISTDPLDRPADPKLDKLGNQFFTAVQRQDLNRAKKLYAAIRGRAQEIALRSQLGVK